jgi:zinc protease
MVANLKELPARLTMPVVTFLLSMLFLLLPAITARAAVTIQEVKSDSGVSAWLAEDYSLPLINIQFVFDGGSSQDPPGKEGLANLMSGLFDEGAGDLDSDAFQIRLDDAGAEMRFNQTRDGLYGAMRMLADHKAEAFDLLRLAIQKPRFDQAPVDRIRAQIVSGIVAGERDPNTVAAQKWAETLYPGHPYSRRGEGTSQSLATITAADLHAFHKAIFARDGLHVAVVGAIDAKTLKAQLDLLFGDLPQKQALHPVADVEPVLGNRMQVTYDQPQTSLQLAYPGIKRSDPDFYAAALMNEILGGGTFTSRLFKEVREKRGLAYGVDSALVNHKHASALVIGTATRSERAAETLSVVHDVVKHMADEGPTEQELAAAKKYVIGAYAINNLDSSGAIAGTLLGLQLDDLGIDYMQRRAALLDAVTLDEVNAVAAKLLSAEPAIMMVGPALPDEGENGGKQ